jgi:medium-chain acyl-[acyl-carrier-protein] hydrolase
MIPLPSSNTWIKCPNPNPSASIRLFCFPYAGSGASIFRNWANSLPYFVEVCAIQLPGREERRKEPLFNHISPLVQTLTQVLDSYLDRPFVFFGHSMGALVSFQLARQLRANQQRTPSHLVVSGRRAPQIPDRNPLLHTLPEDEFLAELRRFNGTPQQVLENPELMQLFLPTIRADMAICDTYPYVEEPPLDCSISVFGGQDDSEATGNHLEGWKIQTSSQFSLQMLPGNHFFLHSCQSLLLEKLTQELLWLDS